MNKEKKKKLQKSNADLINKELISLKIEELDDYFMDNLSTYVSSAQRLALNFGNLRIKYVSFNFTFLAFFATILAIFISTIANFNPGLWSIILPILIGLVIYLIIFLLLIFARFKTISFNHEDLPHYSCFLSRKEYPNIKDDNIIEFKKLFVGLDKIELVKRDLETLLKQYFHQVNHDKVANLLRYCLIAGIIILIVALLSSFLVLIIPLLSSV